jgi:glyoxylase-like metal-dependent hydrolase (beta-lactamase superfamily II)
VNAATLLVALALCAPSRASLAGRAAADPPWCADRKTPASPRVAVPGDWFSVYRVADGVFAILEPRQYQETISYLVVGRSRALLFDTGLGLVPLRPVVESLTKLPVDVLNSHTHFDHVGGNAEFDRVLALDTAYTRANQRGFAHAELVGETQPDHLCGGLPKGVDGNAYATRPWRASKAVKDGDVLDLGGLSLEVLHVPGHTPDAIALLDRANGRLFTGDTYYDGPIWLYVPETDLAAYERSLARLAALAPQLKTLLPAHNTPSSDPQNLQKALAALREVRAGRVKPSAEEPGQKLSFTFEPFSFLLSKPALAGRQGDVSKGGSGLSTWP